MIAFNNNVYHISESSDNVHPSICTYLWPLIMYAQVYLSTISDNPMYLLMCDPRLRWLLHAVLQALPSLVWKPDGTTTPMLIWSTCSECPMHHSARISQIQYTINLCRKIAVYRFANRNIICQTRILYVLFSNLTTNEVFFN